VNEVVHLEEDYMVKLELYDVPNFKRLQEQNSVQEKKIKHVQELKFMFRKKNLRIKEIHYI
jgi:hypothetical protein